MFCANLGVDIGQLSNYVMNKKVVVNVELLCNLFSLDVNVEFKLSKDMEDFNREETIKLLFPNSPLSVVTKKIITIGLSIEDRLMHYTIVKYILPRASNTTNIVEDELFLIWSLKTHMDVLQCWRGRIN